MRKLFLLSVWLNSHACSIPGRTPFHFQKNARLKQARTHAVSAGNQEFVQNLFLLWVQWVKQWECCGAQNFKARAFQGQIALKRAFWMNNWAWVLRVKSWPVVSFPVLFLDAPQSQMFWETAVGTKTKSSSLQHVVHYSCLITSTGAVSSFSQ